MGEIALSETTRFIVDNRGKTAPTESVGIALIATNCINNTSLYPVYENLRYVSKETYKNWFRSHPEPGDIILTLKGSQNGAVCLVPDIVDFVIAQDMVALRVNTDIIDPLYLFAALRSDEVQVQIKNLDVSGVIPHLKKSDFNKLMIPYPEKGIQKSIGEIYYNLSKKIDLLHRQNATLEKLAETLFRQWFVEEAKEEWQDGKLGDLIVVKYGKDHKKLSDGDIPAFGSGGLMRKVNKALYEKESVLIPRKGTLNNVMYIDEPFWTVDTMFYSEMKRPNLAKFIYHFLKAQDLASMNVGSAVPSMTTELLNNMVVSIPPNHVFEKYEKSVSQLYIKKKTNKTQILTLTTMRDILLPKLMSGEARVKILSL